MMIWFLIAKKSSSTKFRISCMLMCGGLRVCKCWGRLPNKCSLSAHFLTNTCPAHSDCQSRTGWCVGRKK